MKIGDKKVTDNSCPKDLKEKFEFKDVDYNPENKFIKRVPGFTFIKTEN